MELMESIKSRRSIRKFLEKEVSRDIIETILESGLAAPSAGNLQARDFFIVTKAETR